MATAIRVRKDVWKLAAWDPILVWYAKAIAEMQTRLIGKPTSWRYQAAIHDYVVGSDPLATPGDILPTAADQGRFWRQCQHNSWFFLPWHRMYLSCFEQIVAAAVVDLGGPDDWALPYWNYSDATNPDARRLPPAFRAATLPDGSPNALLIANRKPGCNTGAIIATTSDVNISTCLGEPLFVAAPAGGSPGFGGPKTVFNHSGGVVGRLEATPHGSMHVAVNGWMGRFNTAGLDPLFWLHHANIDRLWEVWLQRDPAHVNPADAQWLTTVAFEFHDSSCTIVKFTSSQVVDTKASPLCYCYEDVSDPLAATGGVMAAAVGAGAANPNAGNMADQPIPEMIGATDQPIVLTGPTNVSLALTAPTGPAALAAAAPGASTAAAGRLHLNIENITGSGDPVAYEVYVNVPAGENPREHPELFAGLMPMFGVAESSQADEHHSGSGLHYAFDVTDIVRALAAKNAWDANNVQLTFVPQPSPVPEGAAPLAGAAAAAGPQSAGPFQVGRVSLYVA